MAAGIPGMGLGGLFFILSALAGPLVELWRTLRGQRSRAAWGQVGRQFAIAVVMIAAIDLTLRGFLLAAAALGAGEAAAAHGLTVLPLEPLAVTTGVLVVVLLGAKLLALVAWLLDHRPVRRTVRVLRARFAAE